ncbi:hypothetical protein [Aeoliella sp. SH292]|uniref:hypothetical protein n=1 Tax=Aeoliella sp. SH292 TaxID=3454464 RepID=UPI003F99C5F1
MADNESARALAEYIYQIGYREDILDRAHCYDDVYYGDYSSVAARITPKRRVPGDRKHWTRQDKNRADCAWEWEQFFYEHPDASWDDAPKWLQGLEETRQRTRERWFIDKYRRNEHSIRRLHSLALQNGMKLGIHAAIVPLLEECTLAFEGLLAFCAMDGDWENRDSWTTEEQGQVYERLRVAIDRLKLSLPASVLDQLQSLKPVSATSTDDDIVGEVKTRRGYTCPKCNGKAVTDDTKRGIRYVRCKVCNHRFTKAQPK